MATKVLTRYNLRRKATATEASDRPRKRQRIQKDLVPLPQDPLPQDEMASELAKQAYINSASLHSAGPRTPQRNQAPPSTVQSTPSSNKLSAQEQHSSSAPEKADSPRVRNAINKEFISNYKTCATLDEFFQKYMPSRDVDIPLHVDITGAFNGVADGEKEVDMYGTFLKGLKCVSEDFPDDKKMVSYDTSSIPFPPLHHDHHETKPDITSTFPGIPAVSQKKHWTWKDAALVWELKLNEEQDSIDEDGLCKFPNLDAPIRVQLYKGARNLMMAHLSCFVFVVGVYGANMRFFRFDHSGIIGSPSFNYVASPELVQRFLWRLAHPLIYNGRIPQPHSIVGGDPTMIKPSPAEFDQLFTRLMKMQPDMAERKADIERLSRLIDARIDVEDVNEQRGKLVDTAEDSDVIMTGPESASSDEEPGRQKDVKCFAFEVLYFSTGVVGRATHVFKVLILGDHPEDDRICTLKDSWQQQTRWDEGYFYRRIKRLSRHPAIREELKNSILKLDLSEPGAFDKSGLANNIGTWNMKTCNDTEIFGLTTLSARTMKRESEAEPASFDRSRVRSLMKNIGRPLASFRNSKEAFTALRNAVRAIEFLRICGVIHRDISAGNILLHESDMESGFLHDLDYSTPILSSVDSEIPAFKLQIEKDLKDMTGTRPFMAISILEKLRLRESHKVHHDLESIYWVAIWLILRHTEHDHEDREYACVNLFEKHKDDDLCGAKSRWLGQQYPLAVRGNQPLTDLIAKLYHLFKMHSPARREDGALPVTVEAFLSELDGALKDSRWPPNDKSKIYVPPPTEEMVIRDTLKNANQMERDAAVANQKQDSSTQSRGSKRKLEDAGSNTEASNSEKRSRKANRGKTQKQPETRKDREVGSSRRSSRLHNELSREKR